MIEETAIKELPLNGRNFATLVYLVPGITPGQANENLSGASTFNPRGAANFNALGHQANSNGWLVDGIDNNEFTFNTVIVAPSVEQVREFKVLSGVFSAEFGRGAGVVSVSTKSGTNQLRGTVFEFLRNDAFDARSFFVRKTPQPDGSLLKGSGAAARSSSVRRRNRRRAGHPRHLRRAQSHASFSRTTPASGAARRHDGQYRADRGGAQRRLQRLPRSQRQSDPDLRSADDAPGPTGRVVRDQFPNNIIPANRMHPVGQNIASIYPLPNNGSGNFDNYISTPDREITDHAFSGRVDHRFTGQRLGLRAVQLRQVQARRSAGPGELLSADTGGGREQDSTSGPSWPASRTRS